MGKRKRSSEMRQRKLSAFTWQQLDEAVQLPGIKSAKVLALQFKVSERTLSRFLNCFRHPDPKKSGRLTFRKLKEMKPGELENLLGSLAYRQQMIPKPVDLTTFSLAQFFELIRFCKNITQLCDRLGGVTENEIRNQLAFYGTTYTELRRLKDEKMGVLEKRWFDFYIPFKELSHQSEADETEDEQPSPRKSEKRPRIYSESQSKQEVLEDSVSESEISSSDSESETEINHEKEISDRKSADDNFPHFRYAISPKITSCELVDDVPRENVALTEEANISLSEMNDETEIEVGIEVDNPSLFDDEVLSITPLMDSEEEFSEMVGFIGVPNFSIPAIKMTRAPTIATSRFSVFNRSSQIQAGVVAEVRNESVAAMNDDDDQVEEYIVQGISM